MRHSKLTKIMCTISDIKCDLEFLRELYGNGMDVVRLNTAHQSIESTLVIIQNIREVSRDIAILLDTKGPEVRTQGIEEPIAVRSGDEVHIRRFDLPLLTDKTSFHVSIEEFVKNVPLEAKILINDGEVELKAVDKTDDALICRVLNTTVIKNKKTVNVPEVELDLPSLTPKDEEYIRFAAEQKLDFIAHSFVRTKADVDAVQDILDEYQSRTRIIAKIENRQGVNNLDEILDSAYGVIIARGDLGVEIPEEQVPFVQKQIIRRCIERTKPVITATHMLESMIENPRATRAEISDVANAILDGTDVLTLSGETAYGKYPVKAVQTMAKVARHLEPRKPVMNHEIRVSHLPMSHQFLIKKSIEAIESLSVRAIIDMTGTAESALLLSSYRSRIPIFVFAEYHKVVRQMDLSFGIRPYYIQAGEHTKKEFIQTVIERLPREWDKNDLVIIFTLRNDANLCSDSMELVSIENLQRFKTQRGKNL